MILNKSMQTQMTMMMKRRENSAQQTMIRTTMEIIGQQTPTNMIVHIMEKKLWCNLEKKLQN
eukprot:6580904-Ditylum_brightwellii.AAC.1